MCVVRVAVTQHEPCWFNLHGSVDKTVKLIREAAANGAQLISFPECWIPGYPVWIWKYPNRPDFFTKYFHNSLTLDSPEMRKITTTAKEHNIVVVLAYSEKFNDSLYMGQCIIDANGKRVMSQRKLKPTHMERTIFGEAHSGADILYNVATTVIGRVSGLVCWEHIQPLLKYHTLSQRPQIHVAGWPPLGQAQSPQAFSSILEDGGRALTRVFGMESQSFALHTGMVISAEGIAINEVEGSYLMASPGGGSSKIYGPDGKAITTDVPETEERLIYANLDLNRCVVANGLIDCIGQYSRPDILSLTVNTGARPHIRYTDGSSDNENQH